MTVSSSKVVAYGMLGTAAGIQASKVVAYAWIEPGTEAGAPTPEPKQGLTYGQRLRPIEG